MRRTMAALLWWHAGVARMPTTITDSCHPGAAAKGAAAAPAFSPPPGSHGAPLRFTMTTPRRRTDLLHRPTGPAHRARRAGTRSDQLTGKTKLKAFAYKKGLKASAVTSGVFTVSDPPPPPPSETGGTLFLASLTPQMGAASGGSGSSTLTLTQDQTAAILRFSHAGLTGAIISQHIHAADGTILFDIDTTPAQTDGSGSGYPAGGHVRHAEILPRCVAERLPQPPPRPTGGEIKGFFRQSSAPDLHAAAPAASAAAGPPTLEDAARSSTRRPTAAAG